MRPPVLPVVAANSSAISSASKHQNNSLFPPSVILAGFCIPAIGINPFASIQYYT